MPRSPPFYAPATSGTSDRVQSAKSVSVNKKKASTVSVSVTAPSSEVSAMKTRSATAAARAAPKAKAPLDVPETVSSGDTGGVRSWALLLGWCVCSYVLYAALRTAATVIGGKMLPFMCVHTILGFLVAASAATLLALLLFGRAVGANAEIRATNTDAAVRWHEEEGKSVLVPTIGFAKKRGALPRYTLAQVAAHETRDDLWIVIDEKAYDITHLVASHPGGVGPLVAMAGKDCTDVFANYHAVKVYKYMLPRYLVGEVTDVVVWPHVADFRAVRQELLRRGLFETDYRYYAILCAWFALLFLGALYLTLLPGAEAAAESGGGGTMAAHLAGAAVMGIFWQQLAGLGHDLGHSGVSHRFRLDHQVGSSLTALMGLSLCWWKSDHNTHHVVCNALEHDPNIQHMPMLAISSKIFEAPFWDTYHRRWVGMDRIAKWFVSHQHYAFYPLMAFGRLNIYVQGLIYLLAPPDTIHYRYTELCGLTIYGSWLIALVGSLATWRERALWLFVSHAVAGILHIQIVLSHWSMDVYAGKAYNDKNDEWYKMQLRTTMNVATYEPLDFVHIGLQFQIEHHLFPRLPRHSLRAARTLVKAVCAKHKLPYHEPGFFEGNFEMWKSLQSAAHAAKSSKRGSHGFYESALWDGLNLSG